MSDPADPVARDTSFHALFIAQLDAEVLGWEFAFAHELARQDMMKRLLAGRPVEETLKWLKDQTSLRLWSIGRAFTKAEQKFFAEPPEGLGEATCDK